MERILEKNFGCWRENMTPIRILWFRRLTNFYDFVMDMLLSIQWLGAFVVLKSSSDGDCLESMNTPLRVCGCILLVVSIFGFVQGLRHVENEYYKTLKRQQKQIAENNNNTIEMKVKNESQTNDNTGASTDNNKKNSDETDSMQEKMMDSQSKTSFCTLKIQKVLIEDFISLLLVLIVLLVVSSDITLITALSFTKSIVKVTFYTFTSIIYRPCKICCPCCNVCDNDNNDGNDNNEDKSEISKLKACVWGCCGCVICVIVIVFPTFLLLLLLLLNALNATGSQLAIINLESYHENNDDCTLISRTDLGDSGISWSGNNELYTFAYDSSNATVECKADLGDLSSIECYFLTSYTGSKQTSATIDLDSCDTIYYDDDFGKQLCFYEADWWFN